MVLQMIFVVVLALGRAASQASCSMSIVLAVLSVNPIDMLFISFSRFAILQRSIGDLISPQVYFITGLVAMLVSSRGPRRMNFVPNKLMLDDVVKRIVVTLSVNYFPSLLEIVGFLVGNTVRLLQCCFACVLGLRRIGRRVLVIANLALGNERLSILFRPPPLVLEHVGWRRKNWIGRFVGSCCILCDLKVNRGRRGLGQAPFLTLC